MQRALELAATHHPHPNPRVGAVVVDASGEPVGEGAHEGPGEAHAETIALEQAGAKARGSTLYVTLEPCTHFGNTAPCVTAIVTAGVSRVVVGAVDPDERVNGTGISWLRGRQDRSRHRRSCRGSRRPRSRVLPPPSDRAAPGDVEAGDDPGWLDRGPGWLVAMDHIRGGAGGQPPAPGRDRRGGGRSRNPSRR